MDKTQAVLQFLTTCPHLTGLAMFFNLGKLDDNSIQAITASNEISVHKPFITGDVLKRFTISLDSFHSIVYNPLSTVTTSDENLADYQAVQAVIDWINTQNDNRNFPNFGSSCKIDEMKVITDTPQLVMVNTESNPPMAIYRISIQLDYVDTSKCLWNN